MGKGGRIGVFYKRKGTGVGHSTLYTGWPRGWWVGPTARRRGWRRPVLEGGVSSLGTAEEQRRKPGERAAGRTAFCFGLEPGGQLLIATDASGSFLESPGELYDPTAVISLFAFAARVQGANRNIQSVTILLSPGTREPSRAAPAWCW